MKKETCPICSEPMIYYHSISTHICSFCGYELEDKEQNFADTLKIGKYYRK